MMLFKHPRPSNNQTDNQNNQNNQNNQAITKITIRSPTVQKQHQNGNAQVRRSNSGKWVTGDGTWQTERGSRHAVVRTRRSQHGIRNATDRRNSLNERTNEPQTRIKKCMTTTTMSTTTSFEQPFTPQTWFRSERKFAKMRISDDFQHLPFDAANKNQ